MCLLPQISQAATKLKEWGSALYTRVQGSRLLLLLLIGLSVALVYIWPTLAGMVAGGSLLLYAGFGLFQSVWGVGQERPPRSWRILVVFTWIVFLTVLFGDVYFAFLKLSAYPDQYFRVSPDARVGNALARITARRYLTAILEEYRAMLEKGKIDVSAFRQDKEFTWLIDSGIMGEFHGPGPESSYDLDPVKLDRFNHALALAQARLHRYYGSEIVGKITFSEELLSLLVIRWISGNGGKEVGNTQYNVAMLFAAEKLLQHFGPERKTSSSRQLYSAALFFSSMLFMTAGYGDILPNSDFIIFFMATQFVVYIVVFVFMVSFAVEK